MTSWPNVRPSDVTLATDKRKIVRRCVNMCEREREGDGRGKGKGEGGGREREGKGES